MKTIYDHLRQGLEFGDEEFRELFPEWPQMVYNLAGSQKAAYVAQLLRGSKPGLILTFSEEQAQKWVNDLKTWLPHEEVLLFPATEWLPFELLGRSRETTAQRIAVLRHLAYDNNCTIVSPVLAVERRLFPQTRWMKSILEFKTGDRHDLSEVLLRLIAAGFERLDVVEGKGQFALRGGILDIAPLDAAPIRIEFFDDEIDSIRTFDLESQKSVTAIKEAVIAPVLEYLLTADELKNLSWEIAGQARKSLGRLERAGREEAAANLTQKVKSLRERLDQGILDENVYPYLSLVPEKLVNFFSYLSEDRVLILDEPSRLKEQLDFQSKERLEEFTQQLEQGEAFVSPEPQFISYEDVLAYGQKSSLLGLSTLPREVPGFIPRRIINPNSRSLTGFMGKTGILAEEIERWQKTGNVVALFAGDKEHADRLIQGLKDRGLTSRRRSMEDPVEGGGVYVYPYSLDQGFELPLGRLVILSETEIYRRERKTPVNRPPSREKTGERLQFSDLKPGDFVVHVQHGIGQFLGIERLPVGGVEKDYFALRYAGQDRLYVPLDQLYLLQKYLGADADNTPKLYKLGGNEWHKVKTKARNAVKEMAIDLVKLYAQREAGRGFSFSPDNVWQKEFEEKFPYEETSDQLQCIIEVKEDMMRSRPMDRLLCGDVGYGKTEVALRAAFKAVLDSKQAAILVPTTILAQQHFNTFRERFAVYIINRQRPCGSNAQPAPAVDTTEPNLGDLPRQ